MSIVASTQAIGMLLSESRYRGIPGKPSSHSRASQVRNLNDEHLTVPLAVGVSRKVLEPPS